MLNSTLSAPIRLRSALSLAVVIPLNWRACRVFPVLPVRQKPNRGDALHESQGDYQSGKRINLKKVIAFIASDFKKDKIWLRRSMPSKRCYQIILAVDNSLSMTNIGAAPYARQALCMLWKALGQLEVGEVGVCRFGDGHGKSGCDMVHTLGSPLTETNGANVMGSFSFSGVPPGQKPAGEKGAFEQMLTESIDALTEAKARTSHSAKGEQAFPPRISL